MTRVLITGGSGFIGTNLVQHYVERGAEVLNIDIQPPANPAHQPFWRQIDILDKDKLIQAVNDFKPDHLFHLAARADINGLRLSDYEVNTIGVENIVAAAKSSGAARIVFISTQLVCRPGYRPKTDLDFCPPNAYGESKVRGEQIVREQASEAFEWVILRPTSIWGPWFNLPYRAFFLTVRRGRYLQARERKVRKSFGYVGNTVLQLERIMNAPRQMVDKKIIYLADYEPVVVSEWAAIVQKAWGKGKIHDVPVGLLKFLSRIGDGLKRLGLKNPPLTSYRLNNLLTDTPQDMEPLRAVCGPVPFSLEEGTRITMEWMRQNIKELKGHGD